MGSLVAQLDTVTAPLGRRALVGGKVVSLARGDTLWERNASRCFVPASNQKLLIAAAALERLGPEARFRTEALALGPLRANGTLEGDLILRGGGDPLLTAAGLEELAAGVHRAGVRRVRGLLRADPSRYAPEPLGAGWSWDDESFPYAAQVSALSLDGNVAEIEIRPGARPGLPASIRLTPDAGYLVLRTTCRTLPEGARASITVARERGRNEVSVTGGLPLGAAPVRRRVTMEEPALHAAVVWRRILARAGVTIDGETRLLGAPAAARALARHDSAPLDEIVTRMNKASDNLVAEMLLRELGRAPGVPGSTAGGLAVVRDVAARLGLEPEGISPVDGSGLSRRNLLSPENLGRLLIAMHAHPAREAFLASLPVAGRDGTLRARLIDGPAAGNARAKTGTLSHVSALSGYVTTADGELLAFVLVTNNDPGSSSRPDAPKRVEDAVISRLAAFRR